MYRRVSIIIAIIVASVMFYSLPEYNCAFADTQESRKIEQKRTQLRQKISSLSKLERQESNKLTKNQKKLEKNKLALKKSKAQFEDKQKNISKLQKELDSYLGEYNSRQRKTSERIRYIYKTKNTMIFELLISTSSISQFLDRVYYQNLIIKADKEKMQSLKTDARKVAITKQKLESEKKKLSGIIKDINKENANIQSTIKQNEKMIQKIQNDKRAYERSERELKRQSDSLAGIIAKNTKNSGVVVGTGFLLPVQGRVSSPYGWRIHPIFKSRIFHTGIDYAVPSGTPIKASNAGKVIYSGWYGGYGKVVIIDHGSCTGAPTTSLYAHMSRQKVVVGQQVTRGQVIGLVGTTGYATGPHLHFEIRVNGKPQNPNNYL